MNKLFLTIFFCLGFWAENEISKFLREITQRRVELNSLIAQVKIENVTPEQVTESRGEVLYFRPDRLVFKIFNQDKQLVEQAFLIADKKLYEYDASIEQMKIFDISDNAEMEALLSAFKDDLTELQRDFIVEIFEPGDASDIAVRGVMLQPKENEDDEKQHLFQRIRIYLREGDYLPVLIHIINDADSEAFIRLEKIQVNPTLSAHEDQIFLKPGTKIINEKENVYVVESEGCYIPNGLSSLKLK